MTAAAFGWVLAVGKQDRISWGWSEQGRSRNVPPLMTRAPLDIWINPEQILKVTNAILPFSRAPQKGIFEIVPFSHTPQNGTIAFVPFCHAT